MCVAPALLLAVYYEFRAWEAAHALGFPLDDAWIHAQFARNLATGRGFTYDGVHWVAGSTSPAWTSLLALGFLITRSMLLAAKFLGLALQLVCGVLAARLVLSLTGVRTLAVGAGLATAALPAVTWGAVSGMEVTLACALVLGGFCAYLCGEDTPRRRVTGLVLLSFACLARPETLVLLAIVAADHLARTRRPALLLREAVRVLVVVTLILGPFVLFDYLTTGRPLPTTFYAKSGPGLLRALSEGNGQQVRRLLLEHGPHAVRQFGATLVDQLGVGAIVMACGIAGLLAGWRRRPAPLLMLLATVASAYAMGLVAPQRLKPDNFRYTAQLVCLAVVASSCGLSFLWRASAHSVVRAAVPLILVGCTVYQSVAAAPVYARSVKNIQELHVALAEWMRRHLPAGSTIAVNDVGALAYFSERRVVDLEGLVSPEALAYPRQQRGMSFVQATRPDYIAIFPGWYPDIMARMDLFHEIHRVSIGDNYVAAGDVLVVLSTPWTRLPLIPDGLVAPRRSRWPA